MDGHCETAQSQVNNKWALIMILRPCTCFTGVIIEQGHRASFQVPQLASFPFTIFSSVGILDGFFSSTKYIVYSWPKSKLKC